jgi:lipopolysaccharide/colanic/teichoic acid biosynthesis glycosyltransferase
MATTLQTAVTEPIRDAVPFLVITVLWVVVMLVIYGLFLATKPGDITYDAWVHATVFAVPAIGFLEQILQQALSER